MNPKHDILHKIYRFMSNRICFTFAVSFFSISSIIAAIPGFVFMWATVVYHFENDLKNDIILCAIMISIAAVIHHICFGIGRLWGRKWELKRLRIINDNIKGETINPSISTDNLKRLTYMIEKLPDENARLATILSTPIVIIGVLQEVMVSGSWQNGVGILRGCLIAWSIYIMLSYMITEIITSDIRRDARRMLAERNAYKGRHYSTTLTRKFVFIIILMLICTVITHGITSSTVFCSKWLIIFLFSSLTLFVGMLMCSLIFMTIMNTMEEIQETASNLSEDKAARFISSSIDREFLNTSIGLYNAAKKIVEYKDELENLNKNLEGKVMERTAEIRLLSITDPLTGCYNRGYMMEQLPKEVEKAKRYNHSLSIILCDLDHFKRVNDTYGHLVGDLVLKEFVKCTNEAIRKDIDWLARYGGEEFLITLPETDLESASLIAERLKKAIIMWPIHVNGNEINITSSFGVTGFEPPTQDKDISTESMIDLGDKFLYEAKQKGRNLVISGEMEGS